MDNYFLNELRSGVTPEALASLLAEAVKEYEVEMKKVAEEARFTALMNAVIAYIGENHECWNVLDPVEVTKGVSQALDLVMGNLPVANSTEHKCKCGDSCSHDNKIVAKMVVKDENGTHTKDLTEDEINDILDSWLSMM